MHFRQIILTALISVSFLSGLTVKSTAQEKKPVKNNQPVTLKDDNSSLSHTPGNNFSQREMEILEEMKRLKEENNIVNGEKIVALQKSLESTNKSTITRQETSPIGTLIPGTRQNPFETDNITTPNIIDNANGYVGGIAVQVEQRGTTAGKIWVAAALVNGDTGVLALPDTLLIYSSVNNGASYSLYAKIALSSHNKFIFDDMDMEIIENTTGTKYLYVVFGYMTNGGYGQRLSAYTIVSAPTLGVFGSTFFFPGFSSSSSYNHPRITSDNARFPSNPYVTVVVTQDSLFGGNYYTLSKVCRILSPYALNPALTYLPKSIYSVSQGYSNNETTTDVANYHNGDDSLIFVLSNYPGYTTSLYFYKAYSNSVVYPLPKGSYTPTGDNLQYARIAASGGTNQPALMITYSDDYFNTGDMDQWYLRSSNANSWTISSLDYSSYNSSRFGDIMARRNVSGSFSITFKNFYGNMENISAYSFQGNSLSSAMHSVNTGYANSPFSPKPAFRYVNNDSCLNIWGAYYDLYSAGGCSASNIYVKMAIEGMYDPVTDSHPNYEPVFLMLANPNPPYNKIDTALAYLDFQGVTNVFTFPKAPSGNYYLVTQHYNALETWSGMPVNLNPGNVGYYDFTNAQSQAYGGNMRPKGSRWCLYSGDINQDGVIDSQDSRITDNDAYNFVYGVYNFSDVNGDAIVDALDLGIVDNNVFNYVSKVVPQ